MTISIIDQGFNLMLFGMGTVFVFLTILIFATSSMSKIITRYFPEKIIADVPRKKKATSQRTTSITPTTLKIIQAAIEQHRNR